MVDSKYDDVECHIIAFAMPPRDKYVCSVISLFPARQLLKYLLILCFNEIVVPHFGYL